MDTLQFTLSVYIVKHKDLVNKNMISPWLPKRNAIVSIERGYEDLDISQRIHWPWKEIESKGCNVV